MNDNQDTIHSKDVPRSSSLGLDWDEFSRELVEIFASIKLAMFLFKRMGVSEPFIIDQQGVIWEVGVGPCDWTSLDSLQVLAKWHNVTPKATDAQQSDRRERKG